MPDNRVPARRDWERLSARWRTKLDQRIHRLQQLREKFTDCVGCGCLSIDRCLLANPDDKLGKAGTGPRRLLKKPGTGRRAFAWMAASSRFAAVRPSFSSSMSTFVSGGWHASAITSQSCSGWALTGAAVYAFLLPAGEAPATGLNQRATDPFPQACTSCLHVTREGSA